jgi:hypothetical protein
MAFRYRASIACLGAADFYDDSVAHGAIKASRFAGFKCRDSRSVNADDY